MPTYEYACTACGHEHDKFESITAKADKTCPKCKKKKAERKISGGGGLLFKGSGFYVTDYKKSSPSTSDKPAATDKPAAAATSCCSGGACASHSAKPAKSSGKVA